MESAKAVDDDQLRGETISDAPGQHDEQSPGETESNSPGDDERQRGVERFSNNIDVMLMVFARLDVVDKCRVALVCTRWRDAVYSRTLWADVDVILPERWATDDTVESLIRRGVNSVRVRFLNTIRQEHIYNRLIDTRVVEVRGRVRDVDINGIRVLKLDRAWGDRWPHFRVLAEHR
jgi:hypothetical protein